MASDNTVGRYDLVINQGQPLTRTFTLTNASTGAARTGLTLAEAVIKPSLESSTTLMSLNTYLTVDGDAGTVALSVSEAIIGALTFTKPAVWDMFCTFDGVREKMFFGTVVLIPNATS